MATIVQKYGGSSVAGVDKIQAVAAKVAQTRREGNDVVVVVSAMGKTTDELLALAHQIDESPPRRELDMLLSTGERITMALLSMAIQKHGCDAISFTGSQSGIITNDRHFDARIIDVRPHRVEDELARGRVVIIAGFQGMSYKREITTLGRGGSDTTALAMAAALDAEYADIYSDVDGVYSADPRKVEGAQHIPEIGYDEMQAMAASGARVLHHKAVEFARKAKITIRARSTYSDERETLVRDGSSNAGAVVSDGNVALVELADAAPTRALLDELSALGVTPSDVEFRGSTASFALSTTDFPDWHEARARLVEERSATIQEGLGAVSYVAGDARLHASAFLDSLGSPPSHVRLGGLRLTALVPAASLDEVTQRAHDALVGAKTPL